MIERLDVDSMKVFTARAWFVLRGAHRRRDDASIGASVHRCDRFRGRSFTAGAPSGSRAVFPGGLWRERPSSQPRWPSISVAIDVGAVSSGYRQRVRGFFVLASSAGVKRCRGSLQRPRVDAHAGVIAKV